jgi:Ca2+-binding RTX toxin-like protein
MKVSTRRQGGVAIAIAATALIAFAGPAAAQTVPSDLRVVASDGQELTDVRQYVGKTVVPTSPDADCFGPGNKGSGNKVTQVGPDALSVVVEASAVKERLRPLLITDAFLDDGFGLGLCAVGGYEAPPTGFWVLKVNHRFSNLGGSLVTVGPDTETLWYLTLSFPPGNELALSAPPRAQPGVPVRVQVLSYDDDGAPSAATGATVLGASAPGVVDSSGGATLTFSQPGQYVLSATRAGDIPSQSLTVCVASSLDQCPDTRGREILGTDGPDNLVGTLGPDQIRPRGGNDNIKGRRGDDLIVSRGGGADKVKCGGGNDVVEADKKDRFGKSCEKVKGGRHNRRPQKSPPDRRKGKKRGGKTK